MNEKLLVTMVTVLKDTCSLGWAYMMMYGFKKISF